MRRSLRASRVDAAVGVGRFPPAMWGGGADFFFFFTESGNSQKPAKLDVPEKEKKARRPETMWGGSRQEGVCIFFSGACDAWWCRSLF